MKDGRDAPARASATICDARFSADISSEIPAVAILPDFYD